MERELFWRAVQANDPRFDGVFVLGVKTTGIYCKPSCRARLPKRENVEFYDSAIRAEQTGFRACKRCRPGEPHTPSPQISGVIKACETIETSEQISLSDLARSIRMSPFHFQR